MNFSSTQHSLTSKQILKSVGFILCLSVLISITLVGSELNQKWMLSIHANPLLPAWVWALVNVCGDAWVVLLILLVSERRPGELTSWILKTWLLGAVVVQLIKNIIPIPRPANVLGQDMLSLIDHPPLITGSMPSGHAFAAISCALILGTVFRQRGVRWSNLCLIAAISGLAAWARVAVGAHWPSDVIVGAGLAFFVVALTFVWEGHHSWNHWFRTKKGAVFLILIHTLIALYLLNPQSESTIVYIFQLSLACLSMLKAFMLINESVWSRAA
jgi:membrane-associated phospholipid phosphatase